MTPVSTAQTTNSLFYESNFHSPLRTNWLKSLLVNENFHSPWRADEENFPALESVSKCHIVGNHMSQLICEWHSKRLFSFYLWCKTHSCQLLTKHVLFTPNVDYFLRSLPRISVFCELTIMIESSSWENLSSMFPSRSCSNKPAQLKRLAIPLKFRCSKSWYTFQ